MCHYLGDVVTRIWFGELHHVGEEDREGIAPLHVFGGVGDEAPEGVEELGGGGGGVAGMVGGVGVGGEFFEGHVEVGGAFDMA